MFRLSKVTIQSVVIAGALLILDQLLVVSGGRISHGLLWSCIVLLRFLTETVLLMGWCFSIRYRILQKETKRLLLMIGFLMAFWVVMRSIRYNFWLGEGVINRLLWYFYYIPMIGIPTLGMDLLDSLFSADRRKTVSVDRTWRYLISGGLILLVLTNDFHQKVFSLTGPQSYSYQPGYFAAALWIYFLGIRFVYRLLQENHAPDNSWTGRLMKLIIVGAIAFTVLYALRIIQSDLVVVYCLMIIVLLEGAIQGGMIPSNSNYHELFRISSLAAHIVDETYQECYSSDQARPLDRQTMKRAETQAVSMGDVYLHSEPISGGHILWEENVSEIVANLKKLEELQENLGENNELMRAELELKSRKTQVEEQLRIMQQVSDQMEHKLRSLEYLISVAEQNPGLADVQLKRICFIGAYIKRRGNLLILGEEHEQIPAVELEYCIRESLDNLRLSVPSCAMNSSCEGEAASEHLVLIYELIQQILEDLYENLAAVYLHLTIQSGNIHIKLQLAFLQPEPLPLHTGWKLPGGRLLMEREDEEWLIDLLLRNRAGGEG